MYVLIQINVSGYTQFTTITEKKTSESKLLI